MEFEHRFHLMKYKRGSKGTCPQCGKRFCFTGYIDELGKITFPGNVGRCDHESSCGYHYPPRDYFKDNNIEMETSTTIPSQPIRAPAQRPVSFVDEKIVQATLGHYSMNPLHIYLSSVIGKEYTDKLFKLYRVGTASKWNGATVFWQTDVAGKVRSGKVMGYNPKDGHRIKVPYPKVCWAHSLLQLEDFNMKQCFFGEHLLCQSSSDIAIVESEKTAMIASHYIPEFTWLATGGKHGCLNPDALKVLKGRRVHLFPDLQAYDDWKSKEHLFIAAGCKITTSDFLEKHADDEQRAAGWDIGDFLLIEKTKRQLLQELVTKNPALQLLIDKLQLELVEE